MRTIGTFATLVCIQLAAMGGVAEAREGTPSGMSVGFGLDQYLDGSVTDSSGQRLQDRNGDLGLGVLANLGDFAVGGGLGWNPGIFGDGRLLVGARAGWQPTFGTTRVQLLGEFGVHRFTQVAEGLFSGTTSPDFVSTPYVGAQLGITRELVRGALFEYGVALFVRQDLNQQTVQHTEVGLFGYPPPTTTELTVGGTMIGVSLTLGFRVDSANLSIPHHFEFGR